MASRLKEWRDEMEFIIMVLAVLFLVAVVGWVLMPPPNYEEPPWGI